MTNMDEHIRERLAGFHEKQYENVPNCFIFQYGPYIAMTLGYEQETDDISKHNIIMKILQAGAYVLRMIDRLNGDKKAIRDFFNKAVIEVDSDFPEKLYPEERKAVFDLIKHQTEKVISHGSESVMTAISPIIPYTGIIEEYASMENSSVEDKLRTLLLQNLEGILRNTDMISYSKDMTKEIHDALGENLSPESDIRTYYILAALNYLKPEKATLEAMIEFYDSFTDFEKEMPYDAFEAVINRSIANATPAIEGEWEDPNLDSKEHEIVEKMLSDTRLNNIEREDGPNFDLNSIYNFIALNRYMQFDSYSQRVFMDTFDATNPQGAQIINVNRIKDKIVAFELSTGVLEIPYLDLRDYKIRYIYLRKEFVQPFISSTIVYK